MCNINQNWLHLRTSLLCLTHSHSNQMVDQEPEIPELEASFASPPTPSCHFPSHDVAEAALHAWALTHGFNVSRRRPMKVKATAEIWGREIHCDRGGAPKNTRKLRDEECQRPSRGCKHTGCPMRIRIVAVNKNEPDGSWMIYIYDD